MYREVVTGGLSYGSPNRSFKNYEHLMTSDGEYVGHVLLECISRLSTDTTFRVYRSNDLTEFEDYGSGARMCNLFFSRPVDAGHTNLLTSGLCPHGLKFIQRIMVILLNNLNIVSRLMNGTRFIVRKLYRLKMYN